MPQPAINVLQILVSAGSGAVAGSFVSIIIGPTLAEREERGRRRIAARQAIGLSLQGFRYKLSNARLALLEDQPPNVDDLIKSGLSLARATYASLPIVPPIEKRRLLRAIHALIGIDMLEVARLRPSDNGDITDVASVAVTMLYRTAPGAHLRALLVLDPLSPAWEAAISRGEKLSRKYP